MNKIKKELCTLILLMSLITQPTGIVLASESENNYWGNSETGYWHDGGSDYWVDEGNSYWVSIEDAKNAVWKLII